MRRCFAVFLSCSALHFKGHTVGTLIHCGVCFMCPDLNMVKAAEITACAVMLTVCDRTFYTSVCSFGTHFIQLRSFLITEFFRDIIM